MMRRRRMKQTTGGDRAMKTHHKRYKSEWDTWGQSNTSASLLAQPPSSCFPSLLTILIRLLFPPLCSSLSLLSPAIHHFDLALLILLPLLLLPPARLLSLFPSAAVSRPRHPTLPSAADINQPLRGKQREGRRERERWKKREKASRQPVIRTNVDGLRIAGREEHNAFACLFTFF